MTLLKQFQQTIAIVALLFFSYSGVIADTIHSDQNAQKAQLLEADQRFWNAYNDCDIDSLMAMLADNVEFYHDKAVSYTHLTLPTKRIV